MGLLEQVVTRDAGDGQPKPALGHRPADFRGQRGGCVDAGVGHDLQLLLGHGFQLRHQLPHEQRRREPAVLFRFVDEASHDHRLDELGHRVADQDVDGLTVNGVLEGGELVPHSAGETGDADRAARGHRIPPGVVGPAVVRRRFVPVGQVRT
jgi:hypothetical protein